MSFLYGWDTPLIVLNLLLWLSLIVVNPHKAKWGMLLLLWAVSAGLVLLTWFDFSFYAERPRVPVHLLLLMLPVMLATVVIAMESKGWLTKRKWSQTILEWGFVLLLVDVVFYLFPYGYLRIIDYAILFGSLLASLVLLSVKSLMYNRDSSDSKGSKGRSFVSFLLSILLVAGSVILYGAGAVVTNANFNPQRYPVEEERYPVEAGYVLHEGATLYYEVRGEGQPLLLIPGGGGDAGFYTHVVDRLADTYQVITYDRRGNSRSKWDAPHHVEISQQAGDAAAILRTVKAKNAHVFGNSSGAIVAMELATQYPEMLDKVIAHEPPVVRVLPDSSKWKTFFAGIHATGARLGSEAGNIKFTFSVGVPLSAFSDVPKDFNDRNAFNKEILIQEEMPAFVQYQPNIQKLKRNRVDVIFAAGELSLHKQKFFARTAEVLSHEWDQELALFPGHHLSYFDEAEEWAKALKQALE